MQGYSSIMFNAVDFCMTNRVDISFRPDTFCSDVLIVTMTNLAGTKRIQRTLNFSLLYKLGSWSRINHAIERQLKEMVEELEGGVADEHR